MFSSMKKEEYMEPELSALFQVKVVNKNIVPCSLGAQHQASFAVWCLFLEKHKIFSTKLLHLSAFLG